MVSEINEKCRKFPNYNFDQSGSDYWSLYSRAQLLISDFSSTAYSFALGMQRPVIFFSPNEKTLPKVVIEGSYCAGRNMIGDVVNSISELESTINEVLLKYNAKCKKVRQFSKDQFPNIGSASSEAAQFIDAMAKDLTTTVNNTVSNMVQIASGGSLATGGVSKNSLLKSYTNPDIKNVKPVSIHAFCAVKSLVKGG